MTSSPSNQVSFSKKKTIVLCFLAILGTTQAMELIEKKNINRQIDRLEKQQEWNLIKVKSSEGQYRLYL